MVKYRTIVVDPPWQYRNKMPDPGGMWKVARPRRSRNADGNYACMSQEELAANPRARSAKLRVGVRV